MDVGTNGRGINEYRALIGPHKLGDSARHAHPVAKAKTAEIPMLCTSRDSAAINLRSREVSFIWKV